ncbi:MAG: hypothetical protein IJH00_01510 [Erysipelotrichaceae bacterium]|nr:hypothetical protein [Erysipelotrichaceae bacterium]
MKKILTILFICLLFCGCQKNRQNNSVDDNYRVFYEIFTGSFSDSNGDGTGDLQGIIKRLDYLAGTKDSLGIEGIWLTPIFASPSYHKYDVIDYYTIDPDFGNQDDLDELIKKCHERNIIVILDLAINHTSSQHEWFKQFEKAHRENDTGNKYYYYYNFDTRFQGDASSSWCDINDTNEIYECNFSYDMPELNFDNSDVREEVLNIARYYLQKGIDGFRFDAARYIYHNHNEDSADFWKWYCGELRKIKEDVYLVGEVWTSEYITYQYMNDMNCFNFTMSQPDGMIARAAKSENINNFTNYVVNYQNTIHSVNEEAMAVSFISNHDMDRSAGYLQLNNGQAQMAANLYLLSPGSPFIYYGEEIGMKGSRGSANTDANRRLAMLWGDNDTISDPEGSTYDRSKQINGTVKDQTKDKNSMLNYYRKLIQIRNRYPQIARGTYEVIDLDNSNVGGFSIEYNGETTYLIHNNSSEEITIAADTYGKLLDYIGINTASYKDGRLTIGAMTSVILK